MEDENYVVNYNEKYLCVYSKDKKEFNKDFKF